MAARRAKAERPDPAAPPDPARAELDASLAHHRSQGIPFRALAAIPRRPGNPRDNAEAVPAIVASMLEFGFTVPLLLDRDGMIEAGDTRYLAAAHLGLVEVPVVTTLHDERKARRYVPADNRLGELATWNGPKLAAILAGFTPAEIAVTGWTTEQIAALANPAPGPQSDRDARRTLARTTLAQRFIVPPFSVLDARQGYWQERKRAWIDLGIRGELGRDPKLLGGGLATSGSGNFVAAVLGEKRERSGAYGAHATTGADGKLHYETTTGATSVFDPVLCELVYRWFTPDGGHVLDPFAGGSVRGIVAGMTGRRYTGIELRADQIAANRAQADEILLGRPSSTPSAARARIKVSAAMARQPFHGCTPEYIRDVCHARCCDAPSSPMGCIVHVTAPEAVQIRSRGARVEGGLIVPRDGERCCPFKDGASKLCTLHNTPAKPSGCIASPFTVNPTGTLIVRNRYRRLPCYKDGAPPLPAYVAFRASLDLILGAQEAERVCSHLAAGGGDIEAWADAAVLDSLREKSEASKAEARGGSPIATPDVPSAADVVPAPVRWIEGDAQDVARLAPDPVDMVFTCPPYGDLEVYSDDPRDISTMDAASFLASYRAIIKAACELLRQHRFAAIVVGDYRDDRGLYRNFVAETIRAFLDAGLALYNEAVLITAVGSLPVRAARLFNASRKLGKGHQNVLVFVKGDPARAVAALPPAEFAEPQVEPEPESA